MRLIDADEAMQKIQENLKFVSATKDIMPMVHITLNSMHSYHNVTGKEGYWSLNFGDGLVVAHCNNCDFKVAFNEKNFDGFFLYDFCPSCGSKMLNVISIKEPNNDDDYNDEEEEEEED